MPKVFICSPTLSGRKKNSRMEYIISYKNPLSIGSGSTLLLQCKRKHLNSLRHGRAMLTPSHSSAPVIDAASHHSVADSDIPFTKASVLAECAKAFRGDIGPNPHRWSPTVLRKRKQSPVSVAFQLSVHKGSLQVKNQPNALPLSLPLSFPNKDKASSNPSCNEVVCRQQPRVRSDSAALREWIACVLFGIVLRGDQRHQPRPPTYVFLLSLNAHNSFEFRLGVSRRLLRFLRT
jgi:hypothetical protein